MAALELAADAIIDEIELLEPGLRALEEGNALPLDAYLAEPRSPRGITRSFYVSGTCVLVDLLCGYFPRARTYGVRALVPWWRYIRSCRALFLGVQLAGTHRSLVVAGYSGLFAHLPRWPR